MLWVFSAFQTLAETVHFNTPMPLQHVTACMAAIGSAASGGSLGVCSSAGGQHTLGLAICTVHHDPVAHLSSLLHIETLRQQVSYVNEAHEVVHIALYAARHPGVLDLHRKSAPIVQLASMHLSQHKNIQLDTLKPGPGR